MPMHFLGGLWVGSVALWWYAQNSTLSTFRVFATSLIAVLVIGMLWELFEFNIDTLVVISEQNGIFDTSTDIVFDIIGGIVAAIYFIFKK